jgi:serine/threonine-protein kinase
MMTRGVCGRAISWNNSNMPPTDDRTLLQALSRDQDDRRAAVGGLADQLQFIRDEQRREWQAGRRVLAEAYLERFPDIASESGAVADLIAGEYRLRAELGDHPSAEEYAQRFPQHATLLRRRIAAQDDTIGRPNIETAPGARAPVAQALDGPTVNAPGASAETLAPPVGSITLPIAAGPSVPGYELLGELGRGAMGVVYRARQNTLGREVALKMVLSGQFAGKHELERFRAEAVQLAKLQHPNIVQIYEVGECDGRPYFAMEFVPGGSLAKLFEKKPLAARAAAELVETLARAMHHAHERGIIHRDLKPANIMLAADGSPKITDFGLAKGEGSVGDTASYAVLGTPSYMAPEQAVGQSRDVGPAADTYALGSVLYEGLTGRPPFRASNVLDTIQLVTETDPIPPGDLTVNLPRDVETITLKCLQKDPAKRYPSAAVLADDLRRFLDDQPILARPVPAWEKAWKWAKRRPAWAALIATLVVATAVLIGGGLWFNRQLRHERDVAIANADLAEKRFQLNREAVDRYFTGVSESDLLDEPGLQPLRRKLLSLAKDYYARFVEERRDDPAVRADLARSLGRLADITADLDDPRKAIDLRLQVLPMLKELAEANADDPARQADIAANWYELAKLYRTTKQTDQAEAAGTTSASLWDRLARDRPAEAKYRAGLAKTLLAEATLYNVLGRRGPAVAACEQALSIRRKLATENPNDETIKRDLATTWDNLANLRGMAREWQPSADARRQARDMFTRLVTEHPYRSLYRHDLARTQFNLGTTLVQTGQPQPAADAFREAVKGWDRLHDLHPTVVQYHLGLGNALFALSQIEMMAGQPAEADATLAQARTVRADLADKYPAVPDYAAELARCDAEAGDRLLRRGEPTPAVDRFRQAADRLEKLADQHKDVPRYRADAARQRLNVGSALGLAGQLDPARAAIRQALDAWTGLRDNPVVGAEAQVEALKCEYSLGDLERRAGQAQPAIEWFDKCIAAGQNKSIPGLSAVVRDAWWGKAEVLTGLGRYPEAIAAWDEAIALADGNQLIYLKIYRLRTMARTSEYDKALLELDLLAGQARVSGEAMMNVAHVYALAARTAAADKRLSAADRERRSNEAAERAIEHLRLAQSKGVFSTGAGKDYLLHNPSLDFLRERADFKNLIADVSPAQSTSPPG